jgi:hypothetical protein
VIRELPEARETHIKTYYCPARRGPEVLSVMETVKGVATTDTRYLPGALGDYAACVGTYNNSLWPFQNANGAIIQAATYNTTTGAFTSGTNLTTIADGSSNTLMVGEKHVPVGGFGRGPYGDGSIYNGIEAVYSGRIAGREDPLALGPTDQAPSTTGMPTSRRRPSSAVGTPP